MNKHIITDELPPRGQRVVAICSAFRCLGYADENGNWRSWYQNRPLGPVLGWMRPEDCSGPKVQLEHPIATHPLHPRSLMDAFAS